MKINDYKITLYDCKNGHKINKILLDEFAKTQQYKEQEIQCKNCRQDISKDKMFLHEGFCLRNNVFCSHCEKVFLKKDYELHVKLLKNKNSEKDNNSPTFSQKSKETMEETHKPSSFTEESDNYINNNFIQINPKPSLQVVHSS